MKGKLLALLMLAAGGISERTDAREVVRHYIFFSREREGIRDEKFYLNPGVEGAQITYPWRRLEPQPGRYDFSEIEEDLDFLVSKGKKLFIQIQDVTFDSSYNAVPRYLLEDPRYHGGQASQYEVRNDGTPVKAGWVARRWDRAVAERYHLLLKALAKQFDGKVAGVNLPETAVDFPERPELLPEGFTRAAYLEGVKSNMRMLKSSFVKSVTIQYANFMLGDSRRDLEEIYRYAQAIGIGVGGPDIKVYREAQMQNSYPLLRAIAGKVPTGVAVQDGNSDLINPQTQRKVTFHDILSFATDYLRLDYIFWGIEEPFYSGQVLPYLKSPGR